MSYYDGTKLLSYNALFSFIIGGRSIGKSYWFKRKAVKDFLKHGFQFIYVRRYKEELQKTIHSFFNDISHEFPRC